MPCPKLLHVVKNMIVLTVLCPLDSILQVAVESIWGQMMILHLVDM